MLKAIAWIQNILNKFRKDRLAAYSGQSAYFLILSTLPFVLFLLTMVQHLPIDINSLMDGIFLIIPQKYAPTVEAIFNDIHVDAGGTLMSVSVIITVWTAAKGIMAITDGLNAIQEIDETRNYFFLRFKAACYTLLFAIVIIFTVFILVFGNRIYFWIRTIFPSFPEYSQLLSMLKSFIAIAFYILIFTLLYKFLPAKRMKTLHQVPGAIFTTAGWMISSYIFSLYVDRSTSSSYMYGSLSYLILFFIYLYFLMYIFFLGAELNFLLFPETKEDYHLKY
ncbi:MAG: YihY/virulence factor BrkB family protein [Clostridia bacterium]|nr:YihY/virulence factor BrkB family protein [Lachnospiraceae bacterium]NCC01346.1 YihY/virulence factor BrkB family protein [Clostridia bacterium]NCD03170.1 YihY/virulence factor BrkB family protein [Clostridia bacterium]